LSSSYVRLDLPKEYEKVEHLLSLTSNAGMNSRVKTLEAEKESLEARLKQVETQQQQQQGLAQLVKDNPGVLREFIRQELIAAQKQ